jgi:hypothetical protein
MSDPRPPGQSKPGNGAKIDNGPPQREASEIDLYKKGDITVMMAAAGSGRLQPMRGFDEDYTDIVDYIVRCTHKIWEEGAMGLLYTHYSHNCVVHTPYGITYGREAMLADSINALSAFPDRRAFADEVIWTGDDEVGFHTSHRVIGTGRNTGHSAYGPPTGRKVLTRTIANCYVKENMISEEWLVRDALSMVRQLGLDENAVVDRMLEADERKGAQPGHGPPERVAGQTTPPPNPERPRAASTWSSSSAEASTRCGTGAASTGSPKTTPPTTSATPPRTAGSTAPGTTRRTFWPSSRPSRTRGWTWTTCTG